VKLGKAIVIIFASLTLLIVPVSLFYVGDNSLPDSFTLEIQGRFFDAKMGDESGFGFFKFVTSGTSLFNPDAWNQAFTDQTFIGMQTGTLMMILWYVSIGLLLVGIIVAFFKIKISGLFFLLAFITDGLQSLVWFIGMKQVYTAPNDLIFPIPISVLFLLVTFILAFTSKKKDSYYYSPGYSYGYGRR